MTVRRCIGSLEVVLSGCALAFVVAMFFNWVDTYLVIWEEVPQPTPQQESRLTTYLLVAIGSALATFAMCAGRRGKKAYVWHIIVALIVTAGGLLFAVPALDLR
jgi:undecaprenyl pyrophosphate phosphatase UppP